MKTEFNTKVLNDCDSRIAALDTAYTAKGVALRSLRAEVDRLTLACVDAPDTIIRGNLAQDRREALADIELLEAEVEILQQRRVVLQARKSREGVVYVGAKLRDESR